MATKIEEIVRMVGGDGETSYASNSKFQGIVIGLTKPILEKAIEEMYRTLLPEKAVVVDLGCSFGPNTFLVLTHVLGVIGDLRRRLGQKRPPEIQFFLNDLPMNDFNGIFRSLKTFEKKMEEEKGDLVVPYYVAGVAGSFYGGLFPSQSVNFFHSSSSLTWLSQVPQGLENEDGVPVLNKGNIYIAKTSPPEVVKAYQEQFRKDFSTFLKSRYEELCTGGGMVLSFIGRTEEHPADSRECYRWSLLADALNSMVSEGIIEEDKADSFNLPLYAASMEEAKSVIQSEGLFDLEEDQILKFYGDYYGASDDDAFASKNLEEAKRTAKSVRAAIEPLAANHFGDAVLDDLFSRFAHNRFSRPPKEKGPVYFVLVLKKRDQT